MQLKFQYIVFITILIQACTGTQTKQPREVVSQTAKGHNTAKPAPVVSRDLQFFAQQNSEATEFTLEDEQYFSAASSNPRPQSDAEAALAVGIVKYVLKMQQSENRFQEEELIPDDTQKNHASHNVVSVEALALEKGVDLSTAIKSNPLLKNLQFYKLCLKAIKSSSNSVEYTNTINQTIAAELSAWNNESSKSDEIQKDIASQVSDNDWEHLNEVAADVRVGDNILLESQMLADSKRFQEAILKVSQITQQSPLFNQAKEKVILFSDRAVQDLRQKAALAFQNSIPVSDPRSRAVYLGKAKAHLEQALEEYPQAPEEQLNTVRENLAVISRDLEKLDNGQQSVR